MIESDVLVVGGGIAGCVAAIRACELGASVVIVDKTADIVRTGDAGHGVAFLTAYLDSGETYDTPEAFAQWYCTSADGLVDMDVASYVAVEPLPACLQLLESSGVNVQDPGTGEYERVGRAWAPGPIVVRFDGAEIKPRLTDRATAAGARVVGGVHISSILLDGDAVSGAVGVDIRTGEHRVFRSPAVIIATGSAERVLYNSPRHDPFNTYHRPYHGATGFMLAARAGAHLTSIEFLGSFIFPRGFATGAMALVEAGARLVNAHGDVVSGSALNHERSFGIGFVAGASREEIAGRLPLYLDATHLSRSEIEAAVRYISHDAPVLAEFLEQSQIDLHQDLLECEFFTGAWSATCSPKGVVVNRHCSAGVPGLFIAGDLATPSYAIAGALTTGHVAGQAAARHSREAGPPHLDQQALEAEHRRLAAPLLRHKAPAWRELERELQDTMTRYVGITRNAQGLKQALACLSGFAEVAAGLRADNAHELVRTLEVVDLQQFDEMMALAALERDESRFSYLMGHYRSDFPEADDRHWKGVATVVSRADDRPTVERQVFNPSWRATQLAAATGGGR